MVDFSEFREMMLSAEPNILINRQQSLQPRTSADGLSFSSRSSRASDLGSSPSPSHPKPPRTDGKPPRVTPLALLTPR